MTLEIVCHTAVMMRGPPPAPASMNTRPLASSTIVGDIDDSIRLPGSIRLAVPWTSPNVLGEPGLEVKSSISLLRKKTKRGGGRELAEGERVGGVGAGRGAV